MEFMDSIIDQIPNISVISEIELLSWKTATISRVEEFIRDSTVFTVTPEVVRICVNIRRERKIKTPDAIIAATAIANDLILITDNERDFENIQKLRVVNPNSY
jgi:predicted nucleic acid-binding protein